VPNKQEFNIALLRGINVGGKHILPMKDLSAIFIASGCTDVKTYIQSGNVIFRAPPKLMKSLASDVATRIFSGFGIHSPVILRTHAELAAVVENKPFSEKDLYVMFLADLPNPESLEKLDPHRSPPDEFIVRNREIYLNVLTGAAKSKLTNQYFDSRLKTISTARNWRTVLKLLELTSPE
jgi:uncharacterized protein (DUF1697 family)